MILTIIIFAFCTIVSIGMGVWIIWRAFDSFNRLQVLQQKGLTTTGIVADMKIGKASEGATTYTYTVVFTTYAGETIRHVFGDSYVKCDMEKQVPLIYHPDRPEIAEILPLHPVRDLLIGLVSGLLCIGAGLLFLIPLFTGWGSSDDSFLPALSLLM